MDKEIKDLIEGVISGDRNALGKAITLVESTRDDHRLQAEETLQALLPKSGESIRIGITGVPGVGKSTFIESFGQYLIEEHQKKVAVIAVDPSSTKSKGSILGDKTRMTQLASNENAFIRPSPSSGSLGGVGTATREIMLLCEAAGYDVIIVETVGVGQSETEVKKLVDFFMLLMLPGAGDELQGIKRGIVELADAIFINKADGDNLTKANQAKAAYRNALHLFPPPASGCEVDVQLCSALKGEQLDVAWESITKFVNTTKENGYFIENRLQQLILSFEEAVNAQILSRYRQDRGQNQLLDLQEQVRKKELTARRAARLFVDRMS